MGSHQVLLKISLHKHQKRAQVPSNISNVFLGMLKRFNASTITRHMRPFTFNDQLPSSQPRRNAWSALSWFDPISLQLETSTWQDLMVGWNEDPNRRWKMMKACPTRRWTGGVQASELWEEESTPPHLFSPNLILVSPQNLLSGWFWCLDNSSTQQSRGR